jgi:putative DNA primase/helicase
VCKAIDGAQAVKETDAETVSRLAAMPALEYERCRETEARRMRCRVSALDAEVIKARGEGEQAAQELSVINRAPAPCDDPVDGAELLDDLRGTVKRFIVLPDHADVAVALWIVHTYVYELFEHSPILALLSPEKRCGKSVTLALIAALSRNSLMSTNATAAALYRAIDIYNPSLMMDELDSIGDEARVADLRNILNSGFQRTGGHVLRCEGDNNTLKAFPTYCPKAVAAIGKLPETAMDRSIKIHMRRKLRHESTDRLRGFDPTPLRARLVRWAEDTAPRLPSIKVDLPQALNDRAQDFWEPLLIIAAVASDRWLRTGMDAALALSGEDSAESIGAALLADILGIFQREGADRLATAKLLDALAAIEDRPWAGWARGKPLHAHGLAKLLAPYAVASTTIRLPDGSTPKGYHRDHFNDAWNRYLPDETPVQKRNTATTPANKGDSPLFENATTKPCCVSENATKANGTSPCGGVAEKNPVPAREEGILAL